MWNAECEKAYRKEVERRFRDRTPAKTVDAALVGYRVGRSEMRRWIKDELPGMDRPEGFDRELEADYSKWYRRMATRAIKELDPKEDAMRTKGRFCAACARRDRKVKGYFCRICGGHFCDHFCVAKNVEDRTCTCGGCMVRDANKALNR